MNGYTCPALIRTYSIDELCAEAAACILYITTTSLG